MRSKFRAAAGWKRCDTADWKSALLRCRPTLNAYQEKGRGEEAIFSHTLRSLAIFRHALRLRILNRIFQTRSKSGTPNDSRFQRAFRNPGPYLAALMATVKPFAALRPKAELAERICELPYDVMSSEEARQLAAGNPLSFLHVSKPEIDLPPSISIYAPEVYATGRKNFESLISQGALRQDARPNFYAYRQV